MSTMSFSSLLSLLLCYALEIHAQDGRNNNVEVFIDTDFSRISTRQRFQKDAIYSPQFAMDVETTNPDYRSISASELSYHIIHPDRARLSPDEINTLRTEGKIILAYLSIGEAETGLDYWRDDWIPGVVPAFLEHVNERHRDRYRIRFWSEEWQEIILNYMENHILRKGYSGVYLDAVDVYAHFLSQEPHPSAADDMVRFVARIRRWGLSFNPDLLVFVSNAVELYADGDYVPLIEGMVAQNTWYRDNIPLENVDRGHTESVVGFLRQARNDGKTILAVDFVTDDICGFYVKCSRELFRCAVFNRRFPGAVITSLTC